MSVRIAIFKTMNGNLSAKLKIGVLLLLTTFSLAALSQEKNDVPLPSADQVTLPLDEYNKLIDLAMKPPKKSDVPPLSYSIKRAGLNLHVENGVVLGSIQLDGEVYRKGISKVPLMSGITVSDVQQSGKAVPLEQENGVQTALLPGPGEFSVVVDAGLPLAIEAVRASLRLPVPAAGTAQLTLTVPGDRTYVTISSGIITSRKSENGHSIIEATLVPGQTTDLSWATGEAAVPAVPHEVRFLSNVETLASVGEAEMRIAALVDINVIRGQPMQFELGVPAGYEVTGATGTALDSSDSQSGVLSLKLNSVSTHYQFLITMEKAISDAKADVPLLSVKGAQRETGEALVEGEGTMEITSTEGGGLKRMDVKEANATLRALAQFPPQAAFRYHRQPSESPGLALAWVRFPDSPVLAAVAENAEVTTMVTSEGKSLTEVKLTLKNQAQPFLKVALPAGATILSADVAGEKVKPVQAPDGNRVPLLRPGFHTTDPYVVSFVFMHSGAPFAKKGDSDLSLPAMDVPIGFMRWEVFLPEQYKVKGFRGDVTSEDAVPPTFHESAVAGNYAPAINAPVGNFPALLPGQLGGVVVDESGAVISNVKVTITSIDTGQVRTALTDEGGRWIVAGLPSGNVRVQAESRGFRNYSVNFNYDANRPFQENFALRVGSVSEEVTVTGAMAQVQTESREIENNLKKQAQIAQNTASPNVVNLQRRVAGVLPIAIDVPHTGTSFRFVRPLVINEETKVTFGYKSK
jgi:hypothetical protein